MINPQQAEKISALISEIEKQTRGELVAVVVRRSSAVAHVPWVLMGFLGAIFLVVEGLYFGLQWDVHWLVTPAAAIVIYFLSLAFARLSVVQRIFTPNIDEEWQVQQRAELEFHRADIKKTSEGTGILIFVSLMERRAVILADKGISDICPEETWAQTIAAMLEEFKKGRYFEGL
ncbi:MAG: TPM domain-containing protein, partial [Bdellovibrionales bacterium]